jgi:hypothetical protein
MKYRSARNDKARGVSLKLPRNRAGQLALVVVGDRQGGRWKVRENTLDLTHAPGRVPRRLPDRMDWSGLAGRLAAAGSRHRLKIMARLLNGPAGHLDLQRVTGLQAGPPYHHLRALRLEGLLSMAARNSYDLTMAGRNLLLIMAAAAPMLKPQTRKAL